MTIFVPIFLLALLAAVLMLGVSIYLLLRREWGGARRASTMFGLLVACYAGILLAFGLASRPVRLAVGQRKCFDDWCFVVTGVKKESGRLVVNVATINSGRRTQAPDTPRAFVEVDGKASQVDFTGLGDRIEGGASREFVESLPVPEAAREVELYVTEGGFPSQLVIDDENSPFHAKSKWRLRP